MILILLRRKKLFFIIALTLIQCIFCALPFSENTQLAITHVSAKSRVVKKSTIHINTGAVTQNHFTAPAKDLQSIPGHTIVIDPGHGGSDSGAIGPGGTMEKDVTLAVSKKVYDILVRNGATVIMTRTTDRDVYAPNDSATEELQARVNVAENIVNTDIFLCIHANSFSSPAAHGTETYYYSSSQNGRRLAALVQDELIKSDGLADRGINTANFYVLKHTTMPAILVELAFISNNHEEGLLNDDTFQEKLAEAICRGINRYFAGE